MTAPATIRQADVSRVIRAALKAGMPPGSFTVEVVGRTVKLLPIAANAPSDDAAEMQRRMREAFDG